MTLDLPQALLLAFGECGPDVTEDEFNDWYNNEHAPLRLTVKGIRNALRYKAIDSEAPKWLALYDFSSPEVFVSDGYKALRGKASQREAELVSRLLMLDRRLYTHISTLTHPDTKESSLPGKYLLVVSIEPTVESEAEFNRWYEEEHIPLLSKVPGWLRGRRYKCVNKVELAGKAVKTDTPPIPYLAIHEWNRPDYQELPEYAALNTPWRQEISKSFLKREVRKFELFKVIEKPQ